MSNVPSTAEQKNIYHTSRRIIKSLKAKADAKRSHAEVIADWMTQTLGSIPFLVLNTIWFVTWLTINTGQIPGIEPFDPYPFGLLTTTVSLEAIILAIFVLMSQNRSEQVDDLREEIDLQVDIITERELTKLIKMMEILMKKSGIDVSRDAELADMVKPTNLENIEKSLEKQLMEKVT